MAGSKITSQKKVADGRRQQKPDHVPDLTDFMNDMFFGTAKTMDKASYNLTGHEDDETDDDFESSTRSSSSRQTQEWLEQARQMMASSPGRCDSPSRLVGSPRFAKAAQLDRRDPLSRSARRHRLGDGFSGEILTKSAAKHSRNISDTIDGPDSPTSPVSSVHRWFANILAPPSATSCEDATSPRHVIEQAQSPPQLLPPRLSTHNRRSRFQNDPAVAPPQPQPQPRRASKASAAPPQHDCQLLLSPPRNLVESTHRRSISSGTCSAPDGRVLSPPRNLVESAHRRSISSSTCSVEKLALAKEGEGNKCPSPSPSPVSLNMFLKEQRSKMEKLLAGEIDARAKIVLSGPSNNTSSMVAAICYAWLLENRMKKSRVKADELGRYVVVPVINFKRSRMWKQRQAAWLFHHVGLHPSSVLFADEVDLESLMMSGRMNILVVGQDILKTSNEVGSQCAILTDNYCEEAYDLLQNALLTKLLLAGILLDTRNLNASSKLSTTRDAEAVQLLLVGSAPNYRNALFDQLMQDHRDNAFMEVLRQNYGKPPAENFLDGVEHKVTERKSTSAPPHEPVTRVPNTKSNDATNGRPNKVSPRSDNKENTTPSQAPPAKASSESSNDAGRGKNRFFLAKWFGFGSK